MPVVLVVMLKISSIERGSTAAKTGLKKDDLIVEFNGQPAVDMLDVAYFDSQSEFTVGTTRGDKK